MRALRRFLAAALGFVVLALACSTDQSTEPATPGSISGQINDALTSAPISGVSVSTQPATGSVTTDAQGRYSITGVQPGSYAVNASRAGYTPGVANVSVVTGQAATANIALTPIPTTGSISGMVTDAGTSQPIAGATVTTQPATATVTTNGQGNYTIPNAAPGGYTVTAAKSGYQNGSASATVVAGQTATANLPLTLLATRLFLSPILAFKLSPNPTANTAAVALCLSTMEWSATLAEDMVGISYAFSLGVRTAFNSSGTGTLQADIIHKRGSTETALASSTFTTTTTYEVKTASFTGPDPDAVAGDILLLRVRIVPPSPGLPCVMEFNGPATDNFIEVPRTTVQPPPTTGTISGRVTDAGTSQPIAGATVTTLPATATVTTDAVGNYTIPNVAPRGYTVTAAKSEYLNGSASATVVAGETATANITLVPVPTTGTISGQVTDASTSQPIAGATVSTQPATATVTSDAQGTYTIPSVAPGGYTVTAAKSGYQNGSTSTTVVAGQTSTANLVLAPAPPPPDIQGRWVGTTSQNQPLTLWVGPVGVMDSLRVQIIVPIIPGISSCSVTFTPVNVSVGTDGSFTATLASPTQVTGTLSGTFGPGTTASGTFQAGWSGGIICGGLTFGTGSSASGTWQATRSALGVSSVAPNNGPLAGGTNVTITGWFEASVDSVRFGTGRLGNLVRVSATQLTGTTPVGAAPGAVSVTVYAVTGSATCTGCFTYNTPPPTTGTISGRVTDASTSQPIVGATVTTQPATATVTTNGQGNYTIPNVAPGGYTVTAAKSDYQNGSASATVVASQTATANIALTSITTTGSISGTVTDASTSQPIAGATVNTQPATATVTSDAQGNYTIPIVAPGEYTVTAAKSGYQNGATNATVVAGQTATANLALTPVPPPSDLDGTWTGTTSQGRSVSFTVVNNAFTLLSIGFSVTGPLCNASGTATVTFNTPQPIAGDTFIITAGGTQLALTVSGSFSSNTSASGSASFTFVQAPCVATGSATWTATKQ